MAEILFEAILDALIDSLKILPFLLLTYVILEYLESHYGLTYDHDLFFVDYQAIGSNIMPDVTIVRLTEGSDLFK